MDDLAVSVVVPTCGRPELLNRCLRALCYQTLPALQYEIVVVDDRPSPQTEEIVASWRRWTSPDGPALVYLPNPGPHGPAAARNRGWRAARSDLIAFTDDDTVPDAQWLQQGLAALDTKGEVLRGRIVMPLDGTPTDYERDAKQLETADFVTANCFCRKTVLEKLGGFDERFRMAWREDSDLYFRLLELGVSIVDAPQAVVVHPVRPARWGVSILQQKKILFDALLYKKHPQLYRERIRARPRWDYYGIVAMLVATPIGIAIGYVPIAVAAFLGWLYMTARFCMRRLQGTSRTMSHVGEMIITSALIPPCALFWRVVGALRFRVPFT
ncbi:MAG TPA: glycosyltransferase [Oxalicibacterium sp.]|jgi:GT2 family glycosyltransferase|nr:glycosyltransferase [Oxalicibacterium sp.]